MGVVLNPLLYRPGFMENEFHDQNEKAIPAFYPFDESKPNQRIVQ